MNGIARLLNAYGDTLKDDIFVDKVGSISVKELNRTAKERKGGAMGFAEAMLIEYNKRARGTALHMDILHTHRAAARTLPPESEASPSDASTPSAPKQESVATDEGKQLSIFEEENKGSVSA